MRVALTLFFGTFFSEDLTCIAAGLLIHHGEISVLTALLSCAAGIYVSDCGLWAVGRVIGIAAYEWRPVRRAMAHHHVRNMRAWLDRNAPAAIVASRFLPGTRLPLYVTAGVTGFPIRVFARWTLVGSVLWTPTIVLLTAWLGDTFADHLKSAAGYAFLPSILAAVLVFGLLQLLRIAMSDKGKPDTTDTARSG